VTVRRRHEKPLRRVNPSGSVVWVARWTDERGHRSSAGTFDLRGPCRAEQRDGRCCAQHAIWAAYEAGSPIGRGSTVGDYFSTWTDRHPRSERTNEDYNQKVGRVLGIQVETRLFSAWPMAEVRRRHISDLVDVLLRGHGRSASGAVGVVQVLSAMWEDAIRDDVTETNPCKGLRVRASDPRVRKQPREVRVFTWEQMRGFAKAAGELRTGGAIVSERDRYRATYVEAMVRCLCDCGLRLGEMLALPRAAVGRGELRVAQTAHDAMVQRGTKTDHGRAGAGRTVPLPAELEAMLRDLPPRLGSELVFTTPRGQVWRETMFYARIWKPTQVATGLDVRPHEMRHSWISLLLAAGVDPADLAKMAGHTVATMYRRYAHSVGQSGDAVRRIVGGE
jgi:integrase